MCLLFPCNYAVFSRCFEVNDLTVLALHVVNRWYLCALLMFCGQGMQFVY